MQAEKSGIKLVSLYSTIKMMHGPINVRFTERNNSYYFELENGHTMQI